MRSPLVFGGPTTREERAYAMAAHILALFFPIIGAALIYLLKQETSGFIRYHALQALVFQLIAYALGGATCGVGLLLLILPILWAVKANDGEWVGYPVLDTIGRP